MTLTTQDRVKLGAGTTVVVVILAPLWFELQEEGQPVWNTVLFLLLTGIVIAAVLLQRYLLRNLDQVGEARFDTRNKE